MAILSPDGLLLRLIQQAGVWDIIFYRSLFMGISLAAVLAVRYRRRVLGVVMAPGRLGLLSTLLMAGANLTFIGAITQTTVANTLVILATMPLFSAILGWALIGESVQKRTWVTIGAAAAGITVIFIDSLGGGSWVGDLLAVLTALLHGLNLVVLRRARQHDMMPALCLSGFLSALIVLPLISPAGVLADDFLILAFLGFILLPLSLSMFLGGTRSVPAAEVALLALVETVLGPLWVWLGVGEVPTALALLGGMIVIGALAANAVLAVRARSP
jgi:drug/metabolite transporter (DMT)-like permease